MNVRGGGWRLAWISRVSCNSLICRIWLRSAAAWRVTRISQGSLGREPGIRFPKYWRCSIKGKKKSDALGRHFWHFLPRSNIYDLGRPIEDLSLNWCYLRGQKAGGKYLASLWLKLQNRQKMRFLCRSTLSRQSHQPIGSACFRSYASMSLSQFSWFISARLSCVSQLLWGVNVFAEFDGTNTNFSELPQTQLKQTLNRFLTRSQVASNTWSHPTIPTWLHSWNLDHKLLTWHIIST